MLDIGDVSGTYWNLRKPLQAACQHAANQIKGEELQQGRGREKCLAQKPNLSSAITRQVA